MRAIAPLPEGLNLEIEELFTEQHPRLSVWHLPPREESRGTVLFLHGNAENVSTHLRSVYWLPKEGYRVLALDYRGYGRSEGSAEISGLVEDVQRAIEFSLRFKSDRAPCIYLLGESLGASLALYAAANTQHRASLCAVVAHSPFAGYRKIAREKLSSFWLTWALQIPLSWTITTRFDPLPIVANIAPVPILFIHGGSDRVVPPHHSQWLLEAAARPKERWLLEGVQHIEALRHDRVRGALTDFFKSNSRPVGVS